MTTILQSRAATSRRFPRRRSAHGALLVLTALLASLSTGCADLPERESIVALLQDQLPAASFTLEDHVHLGPVTMWFARRVVAIAGDHDQDTREVNDLLRTMREVEVATYRVRDVAPDALQNLTLSKDISQRLAARGWTQFVRVSSAEEQTLVLAHQQDGEIMNGLFVFSLDHRELSLVRIDGRIDKALAYALAKSPKSALASSTRHHDEAPPSNVGGPLGDSPAASPVSGEAKVADVAAPPPIRR